MISCWVALIEGDLMLGGTVLKWLCHMVHGHHATVTVGCGTESTAHATRLDALIDLTHTQSTAHATRLDALIELTYTYHATWCGRE